MSDAPRLYHVRQYRPAYFDGFENAIVRDVPYDGITEVPWADGFRKDAKFVRFTMEQYKGEEEVCVSAHYADGSHWVVSFAVDAASPAAKGWRYTGEQPT